MTTIANIIDRAEDAGRGIENLLPNSCVPRKTVGACKITRLACCDSFVVLGGEIFLNQLLSELQRVWAGGWILENDSRRKVLFSGYCIHNKT